MRSRRMRLAVAAAALTAIAPVALSVARAAPRPPIPPTTSPLPVTMPDVAPVHDPAGVLAGRRVRGMVLESTCQWPVPSSIDFARLKLIGVNTIQIVVCGYVNNFTASTVAATDKTPSDVEIATLINLAHLNGFAVSLIPSWWVEHNGGSWRGHVHPTNVSAFFASYQRLVEHWAALAQEYGAEIFGLGTEAGPYMESFSGYWIRIARAVEARFYGITTYQSTGIYAFDVDWWRYLDLISVSAYYSLSSSYSPPVGQLKYEWLTAYLPGLYRLSRSVGRPLLISEVGYSSVAGTAIKPSRGPKNYGPRDEKAQADAYDALLATTQPRGSWFRGLTWFRWDAVAPGPIDMSYSPRDKLAECVLARYWSPSSIPELNTLRGPNTACVAKGLIRT